MLNQIDLVHHLDQYSVPADTITDIWQTGIATIWNTPMFKLEDRMWRIYAHRRLSK